MKKGLKSFVMTMFGLALGLVFYLLYIHVISGLSYTIGLVFLVFVVLVLGGALINLIINLKDFFVSIFKDNDERDHRGFKKHF